MAIKLKKTVKKFSSTKSAWDELENCIKDTCSDPIKKLIDAGESQDKIKDTVNYLIDHIMEDSSEKKEFSGDKVDSNTIQGDDLLKLKGLAILEESNGKWCFHEFTQVNVLEVLDKGNKVTVVFNFYKNGPEKKVSLPKSTGTKIMKDGELGEYGHKRFVKSAPHGEYEKYYSSEKKKFSDSISKDQLLNLSSSDTNKFKTAMDSLVSYANGLNETTFDETVRKVDRKVDSTLKSIFGKLPDPLLVLTYLHKGMHIDWWSLEDLGYTTEDGLDDVYYELAHRAVEDTHKF